MTEFIVGFVFGIAISLTIVYFIIKRAEAHLMDNLKTIMEELEQETKKVVSARVEQHNGIFYVYNAQDNTFITQGSTLQEIRTKIEDRMKDVTVIVTEGDELVLSALKEAKPDA